MNGGRSDASTSTDDVKSRPLCLFYFTHPFGVLSPEPPTLAAAPPHIARAFVNMEPVSPFTLWSPAQPSSGAPSDDDYNTASSASRPSYELGNATVHTAPLNLVSVTRARNCTLDFCNSRDSISSSLFSSDVWFNSSSSCKSNEYPRRLIPYKKILPPLQLPNLKDSSTLSSSDDYWPKKCLNPEKFSLPPIEMPSVKVKIVRKKKCSVSSEELSSVEWCTPRARVPRVRRRLGVSKPRRPRPAAADLRRLLAALMRRALTGSAGAERNVSPALREALYTIREAWAEPRSLHSRCRTVSQSCVVYQRVRPACGPAPAPAPAPAALPHAAMAPMDRAAAELPPRLGASPGLLRRRYSVPETIMRKYRLAQQRSDSEESAPPTTRSAASASPPPTDTLHRFARRDRELMRKSALMRRMWGRPCEPCRSCCCCGAEPCEPGPYGERETRSLDGSRSELRQLSSSFASSRYSHAAAGWATPKRQRLDSSRDFRGSDEMLRAAMRNSYDRAEESRHERGARADLSDSTYQSHRHDPSSYIETITDAFTDSDCSKCDIRGDTNAFNQYSERQSSETTTLEIKSATADDVNATREHSAPFALNDERSLSDTSETYSVSYPTTKESTAAMRARAVDRLAHSVHIKEPCADNDALPYDKQLTIHTPSYEVLEIVVSETLNADSVPTISSQTPEKTKRTLKAPTLSQKCIQTINIDEYVSNILVESLNSLTDQLECMNASMGNERKINIVEKEIKVKLQNTGVNTIVHLSPTSNNQIIFGNEELCINEEHKDSCNDPQDALDVPEAHYLRDVQHENDALAIRDEAHSSESNNNVALAESPWPNCDCESFDLQHDNVNQAVLQQIQKLFQDELQNLHSDYSGNTMPEISHIEISNVTDVFIHNEHMKVEKDGEARNGECEFISGVGTGSYYPDLDDNPVVPRFSAFPHTDSMEVNTSSSDDAEIMGSDCTSLVDSLDDPNSPRSVLLRRAFNNRRSELVRSAIDVLDLLPENVRNEDVVTPKDKGESFFIKIKDTECDCDKENVNVADRMPEKIKQRLYRRHRKREMRMECARRTRCKQRPRDTERRQDERRRDERRRDERCRSRDVERDCAAIVNALIDDVIAKIAQDEYKYMRIKHRPSKMNTSKSDDNITKRTWKKELDRIEDRENTYKASKNSSTRYDYTNTERHKSERHQIHGKLSLLTRPAVASDDRAAKRVYQKSEIHDGNKCIEILEILEYVNDSQSSPEATNSDENLNNFIKNKKSRIPIPIQEKTQRSLNNDSLKMSSKRSSLPRAERVERNGNTNRLIANMLLHALAEPESPLAFSAPSATPRRASVPHAEPRSRSNSLRFKQTFDIIPEERSSLSVDSGNEDLNHNRRASAPDIADQYRESTDAECNDVPPVLSRKLEPPGDTTRCKDMKSTGTSPITDISGDKRALRSKNQITMTSPGSKSAATSPMRTLTKTASGKRGRAWLGVGTGVGVARADSHAAHEGYKESAEIDKVKPRRSVTTQYERTQGTRPRAAADGLAERPACTERSQRPPRHAPRRTHRAAHASDNISDRSSDDIALISSNNQRKLSLDKSDEDGMSAPSTKLPEFKGGGESGGASSSDSSESGGSLLCSLAPKWLAQSRTRRASRRRLHERAAPPASTTPQALHAPHAPRAPQVPTSADPVHHPDQPPGGWSVTVAGSCRAALPADVEMRLRFPHERDARAAAAAAAAAPPCQECTCRHCATCACSARETRVHRASAPPPLPPAAHHPHAPLAPPPLSNHAHARLSRTDSSKLTLTMKKEALDSSILASKSVKKSGEPLPEVETYRASRSKLKSSVKTHRGYSLHCWLPENEVVPIRASNDLSVLGSAIIPELKPRVPTMSERDLTRVYTPRHYLRS